MKIAVYTALYGDKDVLRAPLNAREDRSIDYFVFSDNPELEVAPYRLELRTPQFQDVAKNARYYKIMGDPILEPYDYVIWHDANIQLNETKIKDLISLSQPTFLTTFSHPNRDDFYSEAMSCIRVGKDFSLRILKQVLVCFFNGMPAHEGMYATGILVRNYHVKSKIDPKVFMRFWWEQTLKYSRRDQLSLAYSIYKMKMPISCIKGDILHNDFSTYHRHKYTHYINGNNLMRYNVKAVRTFAFYGVQVLRKLQKL
ncbi:glycosyltransferase domain-containing protein [Mangrovimonas sp. TPBH4]|uniref:glycosyltransferase domain-containing protein n=1 Tax=Mangrovimonas sp. TPBH4 TaxID=1645914 RepID=UPI0006B520B9|nr:glycosyltransferase domain-containing protein [Mangrovimonas sp. TPBH4]